MLVNLSELVHEISQACHPHSHCGIVDKGTLPATRGTPCEAFKALWTSVSSSDVPQDGGESSHPLLWAGPPVWTRVPCAGMPNPPDRGSDPFFLLNHNLFCTSLSLSLLPLLSHQPQKARLEAPLATGPTKSSFSGEETELGEGKSTAPETQQ